VTLAWPSLTLELAERSRRDKHPVTPPGARATYRAAVFPSGAVRVVTGHQSDAMPSRPYSTFKPHALSHPMRCNTQQVDASETPSAFLEVVRTTLPSPSLFYACPLTVCSSGIIEQLRGIHPMSS